jgi:glycosyltransferase involved in cell wall biosynthesis
VVLLETTVAAYEQGKLDLLSHRLGGRLTVVSGPDDFDPTIRLAVKYPQLKVVSNHFLMGRRLLWQSGMWGEVVSAGTAIIELNPRVLSTWPLLVARRVLRRPTILWGHAWPRRGRGTRTDSIRQAMRRLADGLVVYTETQARELRTRMPSALVEAAPNGLYSIEQAGPAVGMAEPSDFVFVGRLVEAKKPGLLLDAFIAGLGELPDDARVVFVGDGPLHAELVRRSGGMARDRVVFLGSVWEFSALKAVYATALACVSPGYVGLSIIQSLWFGVPAIIARDEPHSPEIEAAVEDKNAVLFESDSVMALRDALVAVTRARRAWVARRSAIAQACAAHYSIEAMIDSIMKVIEAAQRER